MELISYCFVTGQAVGNNTGEFVVGNATAATQVWDITDPLNPLRMQGTLSGNQFRFVNHCDRLQEYVAFNPDNLPVPTAAGTVANQDLHNASPADYIIVVHPPFLAQAQRLAQFHQQRNGI